MENIANIETQNNSKLWEALSKAQGKVRGAFKSAENPFFKSKFANLEEVILSVQEPMNENGLAFIFDFKSEILGENPTNWIRYILTHSSGQLYSSNWVLMFMKDKTQQGFGASCTYYKRQLLKAAFNIPETDDDGNSQSAPAVKAQSSVVKAPQNFAPGAAKRG